MRVLVAVMAVLLIAVPAADGASFAVAPGDAVSVTAGDGGEVYAVTRGADGVLTACALSDSQCSPSVALAAPEGAQAGFRVLRRPSDGALFVLDSRDTGSLWVLTSTDDAATWSEPVLVATGLLGFADAALASDGVHADVIAENAGGYVRVALAGPPASPFLNLALGRPQDTALDPAIASLRNGSVIASFAEIPPPGPGRGGLTYGIRRHAAGGDLHANGEWSPWKGRFTGDGQTVFARGNRAYLLQTVTAYVQGNSNGNAAYLRRVTKGGRTLKSRLIREELQGSYTVGTFSRQGSTGGRPPTVHVAIAGSDRVSYTRTTFPQSCWFGPPVSVPADSPADLDIAVSRSARGLVAWVEGDAVRANWFTGGFKRSCR